MAELTVTVTVSRRELARLYWPAAIEALDAQGLMYSPRAWLLVAWWWLRLRFTP